MSTTHELPELPEGFVLYGKGPLKSLPAAASPDIIFWDPAWGTYGWDRSSYRGTNDFGYYALSVGSDVAVANGVSRKTLQLEFGKFYTTRGGKTVGPLVKNTGMFSVTHPFSADHFCWQANGNYRVEHPEEWNLDIVAEKKLLLVPDESTELYETIRDAGNAAVDLAVKASPAYKQLEAEFIQQRTELADARNRVVDLERERDGLRIEVNRAKDEASRQFNKVQNLVGQLNSAKAEASRQGDRALRLEHQLNSEITDAAQRIIALQDECGRLVRQRDNWQQTAAQHLRNEQFYRDLLGQCAELLGDECRRSDDGRMIPKGDFLALRVPEVLRFKLEKLAELRKACVSQSELLGKHVRLGHRLFGPLGAFPEALTMGQDVVLDGMKWMEREILRLRSVDKPFEFPQGDWSVSISDGFCAFNYVFSGDVRKDTCVDDLVALLAAFLKGDATLVSRELL